VQRDHKAGFLGRPQEEYTMGNIRVVYRFSPQGNMKRRPEFFSKRVALVSFVRALQLIMPTPDVVFIVDGDLEPRDRAIMESQGTVVSRSGLGNSGSFRLAMTRALQQAAEDQFLYLAEDDYFYRPLAFQVLAAAQSELPTIDYFTLYDHPDRYGLADVGLKRTRIYFAGGHHWRSVESTCMTFAARARALKQDRWVYVGGTLKGFPRDRLIWRVTCGSGAYVWKFPRRTLVGPMPSLATHAEVDHLAPGVDWGIVAAETVAWGRDNGMLRVCDGALGRGATPLE
jgi:hypothetical protein